MFRDCTIVWKRLRLFEFHHRDIRRLDLLEATRIHTVRPAVVARSTRTSRLSASQLRLHFTRGGVYPPCAYTL
jgi:hypothetical protein